MDEGLILLSSVQRFFFQISSGLSRCFALQSLTSVMSHRFPSRLCQCTVEQCFCVVLPCISGQPMFTFMCRYFIVLLVSKNCSSDFDIYMLWTTIPSQMKHSAVASSYYLDYVFQDIPSTYVCLYVAFSECTKRVLKYMGAPLFTY